MSKFKLADLGATSVPYELKHPKTGEGLGVTIDLVGPDSAEFRALTKSYLIKHAAKAEKAKVDIEAALEQSESLLAICIVGWSDDEFFGGAYSREFTLTLLRESKFRWMRDQIDAYTNDRTNFFR